MGAQRPRFEVADVVRAYGDAYRCEHRPSSAQERVLHHISACRTELLGGHVDECDGCGHVRISYNSCRDRHCPKCQASRRHQWLAERLNRLLPVPYFHVVFTLPDKLNPLAIRNKRVIYGILFDAASKTLMQLAQDPRRLGAQVGVTAVLHTWGQNMLLHPHLHCVVTGGGLSADGPRWVGGRERYFLPVKVLGKLFRGKFLALLDRAYTEGRLELVGSTGELDDPTRWAGFRNQLYSQDWVVYAKPPFGGAEAVFRYLGNYTHRVAISNHRIIAVGDGTVTFTLKDYKDGAKTKTVTLESTEFLRRFLLHVLPKGFVRIRHYGLVASRNVGTRLVDARRLIGHVNPVRPLHTLPTPTEPPLWWERLLVQTGIDVMQCPCCGGRLSRRQTLPSELVSRPRSSAARAPPALA